MNFDTVTLPRTAVARPTFIAGSGTRALPMLFAVAGTAGLLGLVYTFAPPDGRVAELLLHRGWTQPITLALAFWGLGHVVRRLLVQGSEQRALAACRELVGREPLDRDRVSALSGALFPFRETLSGPVIGAILSYFRSHRPSRDEVLKVAHQEIDRAYDRVEGDYGGLAACMWLLPLSGFLGTVVGMAAAIGSFHGVIATLGSDLSALTPTVAGLATAFDTTLLALALVVPLKLLEVGLEGRDRRILEQVDRTLGAGLVRELDLNVLAQQSPEEAAIDRFSDSVERIELSLRQIDDALASITAQVKATPGASAALAEVISAARATNAALPRITEDLRAMRTQGDQPMILARAGRKREP